MVYKLQMEKKLKIQIYLVILKFQNRIFLD